jgi:hypothetical protein
MSDETRCPKCGGPAVQVTAETLFCTGSDLLARNCPGVCRRCGEYHVCDRHSHMGRPRRAQEGRAVPTRGAQGR